MQFSKAYFTVLAVGLSTCALLAQTLITAGIPNAESQAPVPAVAGGVVHPSGNFSSVGRQQRHGIAEAEFYFTLVYLAGPGGSISGTSPQYIASGSSGSSVSAIPNAGYRFVDWSDGSTANPRTDANVRVNMTVTANFALKTYTLTYRAGSNGSIQGTTPQVVNHGASGTPVAAVPNSGHLFVAWSDGSTANPRKDTNVNESLTVTANFAGVFSFYIPIIEKGISGVSTSVVVTTTTTTTTGATTTTSTTTGVNSTTTTWNTSGILEWQRASPAVLKMTGGAPITVQIFGSNFGSTGMIVSFGYLGTFPVVSTSPTTGYFIIPAASLRGEDPSVTEALAILWHYSRGSDFIIFGLQY